MLIDSLYVLEVPPAAIEYVPKNDETFSELIFLNLISIGPPAGDATAVLVPLASVTSRYIDDINVAARVNTALFPVSFATGRPAADIATLDVLGLKPAATLESGAEATLLMFVYTVPVLLSTISFLVLLDIKSKSLMLGRRLSSR